MTEPEKPIVSNALGAQILPKNFLRPCLLLLLREHPAHGYDLLERLRPLGFNRDDPGRLYRALRALEGQARALGLGEVLGRADRRMYEITRLGMEELHESVASLKATGEILELFILRYTDFVAQRPQRRKLAAGRD